MPQSVSLNYLSLDIMFLKVSCVTISWCFIRLLLHAFKKRQRVGCKAKAKGRRVEGAVDLAHQWYQLCSCVRELYGQQFFDFLAFSITFLLTVHLPLEHCQCISYPQEMIFHFIFFPSLCCYCLFAYGRCYHVLDACQSGSMVPPQSPLRS